MKKVTKNYILNLSYNILILLVPLVTTPYISRVLGAEGIGIYNYCLSISTYFIVAGTLGVPLYGKREIAYRRENQAELNKLYSELVTLQFILLGSSLLIYSVFSFFYVKYTPMLLVCGVGIAAALFDISWLYIGIEDFTTIVTRGVLFKVVSVASIFVFVKKTDDVYVYALSIMLANFIGNVWMFWLSRKRVEYQKPKFSTIFSHIKPALFLLLPNIVTTIYAVIDKTLLGALSSNMSEVGYYEQSQKIVTLSLTLVTSLGTILMPRIASLFSKSEGKEIVRYLNKGIKIISFISLPLVFGLYAISDKLVPWFYGAGFEKVNVLLKIFAPMLFFMGMSDLLGTQVLIASKLEKKLFLINAITCLINIVLDVVLIPRLLCYGAAIATLISEIVKLVICYATIKKFLRLKIFEMDLLKYLISALGMGISVYLLGRVLFITPNLLNTITLVVIGGIVYFGELVLVRDELLSSVIQTIWCRLSGRKNKSC